MKPKSILTIGGGTQDIFISYKNTETVKFQSKQGTRSCLLLEEGAKIEISDITYATGGGATNSGVSFQRLGFSSSACCKLGNDLQAQFILESLKKESINTSYIQHTADLPTGTSFILPSPVGNHTILAYRGANKHLNESDIPFDTLTSFDQLYITSLSGASSAMLIPVCKQANKLGIPVATNPGSSQLAAGADVLCEALKYIDILILNSDEAKKFMLSLVKKDTQLQQTLEQSNIETAPHMPDLLGSIFYENIRFSLPDFFKQVLGQGPRIVVVTNGKEGVYVASETTMYFHPSIPTNIASTVGAGDAFGSCFVASITQGQSLKQALLRGIINASSAISFVTAKEGLLDYDTLEEKVQNFDASKLQTFSLINHKK